MSRAQTPAVAAVTGGASGMGRLIVQGLVDAGAKVAVLDVNEAALQQVAAECPSVTTYRCDTSNQQQVEQVIAAIEADLGPIDRMVHCAAIMPGGDIATTETELINRIMSINYMGTVNVTKAVLPSMLARDCGELVVIGSMAGTVLTHGLGPYCASKSATNTYMEVLQQENRDNNVFIMLVCPPMVNTPLIAQAEQGGPSSLRLAKDGDRMATPESIVAAIDKGLAKRQAVVKPGEAGLMMWLSRFSPALMWRVMRKANERD